MNRLLGYCEMEDDMDNKYLYRAKRLNNDEWIEGVLLPLDDGTYRIITSCLISENNNLLTVCTYEVDESTINEVEA